jgi:porphobilinogen synthase
MSRFGNAFRAGSTIPPFLVEFHPSPKSEMPDRSLEKPFGVTPGGQRATSTMFAMESLPLPGAAARFPARRMRRLRRTAALRRLVAETSLVPDDLVAPLFVREGIDEPLPITSMPGHFQHTATSLVAEAKHLASLGIPAVVLFGVPVTKDAEGSSAWDPGGIVQVALTELRSSLGDAMVLIADLCLDEYTDHGHCGVLRADGSVDNDATLERYARAAVAQADAGADIVAPSGMMDGQVAAIRSALDDAGHAEAAILAYAAKYASALYGPFRDAVDVSIAAGGDRRGYQQDPRNRREALAEVALDVAEGADIVMVKPAVAYLDVLADVARAVDVPVAAYHVSGEYSMVKAASERGWIDGDAVMLEHVTAVKRAGATAVLTYAAAELARLLGG